MEFRIQYGCVILTLDDYAYVKHGHAIFFVPG